MSTSTSGLISTTNLIGRTAEKENFRRVESIKCSDTGEPLPRVKKPFPMVPALPGALELYGNIPFSAGAAMGAWESSGSFEGYVFWSSRIP